MTVPVEPLPVSRRERARDATTAEIKQTARALLVEQGAAALTLRAIAREMGMTAPGLYRYFASHEDLVTSLCTDTHQELTSVLAAARDTVEITDPVGRLLATCRAFRRWSLEHPREFELTFASPAVRHQAQAAHEAHGAAAGGGLEELSFGAIFLGIFVEIWAQRPFPVPADTELPASLVAQLKAFSARVGDGLPTGALAAFLAGWVRLYGAVTIEAFGHLGFALDDAEPMFEAMLADMARSLRPA